MTAVVKHWNAYVIYYRIAVSVTSNTNPNDFVDQRIGLYVNGVVEPNSQTSFGIYAPDITSCVPISRDAIISTPANASL